MSSCYCLPGKAGGFPLLDNIDQFDAAFFGIAPVEAKRMDPQHRLLLEVCQEALMNAGVPPDRIAGSKTGVFIAISFMDYGMIQDHYTNRVHIGANTQMGSAQSIAANRISYVFDLHGPSFIVDTACSSSLVAMHQAIDSLQHGESEMALVGGVNMMLKPEGHIGFSKGGFLAPDSRCKSFDSRANGYIRSEGVGIVLLKPLSRAIDDGDRPYALIRGSACNQDGRTGGITVPNPDA